MVGSGREGTGVRPDVAARRGLVAFVEYKDQVQTWKGYAMAIAMFASSVGHTTLYQNGQQQSSRVGIRVRAAIIDVVFRKSLVLAPSAAVNAGGGDIVNLLAVDLARIQEVLHFLYVVWLAPLAVAIGALAPLPLPLPQPHPTTRSLN